MLSSIIVGVIYLHFLLVSLYFALEIIILIVKPIKEKYLFDILWLLRWATGFLISALDYSTYLIYQNVYSLDFLLQNSKSSTWVPLMYSPWMVTMPWAQLWILSFECRTLTFGPSSLVFALVPTVSLSLIFTVDSSSVGTLALIPSSTSVLIPTAERKYTLSSLLY